MEPNRKDYLFILVELMFKLFTKVVDMGHAFLNPQEYQKLFDPTIDWVIQCIAYQADRNVFKEIWAEYQKGKRHAVFLKSIIKYFPSEIISVATTILIKSIKDDLEGNSDG